MNYKELINDYKLEKGKLEQAKKSIADNIGKKQLSYGIIKSVMDITKPQFYFSLYDYMQDSEYISKDKPDKELLIKVSNREKFKEIKLPFEERNEFLGFVILYINKKFSYSFVNQILKINSSDYHLEYFQIQHEMSKAIPFLILTNEDLLKILNHFAEQAEKDMTVGEVYNACENFCKNNPEQGWNLVDYMKKNNKPKFLINALVGLSVNESEKVFNYTNNLYRTEFITQAIIILGFINYNTIEQVNKTFEKFKEQLKKSVKENIIALSNSLGRLLYQPITAKYNLVSEIFGFISQILNKKIPEAQYNILNNLTFINEKGLYNEYKVKLLKYFYDASYEYKGIIQNLSYYLHDLKNPLIILDFLRNWILNHDEIKDLDDFEYALQDSYTNNPEQFIEEYIKLLIHPKAKIRNTIKTIFKIVILSETNKELWIKSINSLTFKQQKLLFKSLNDYSIDIKDRLTIGSLLIKTHNHNVYKFLLQEFVWLIQDFGSMIKDILDNIVDKNDGMEADFINAFINYYQEITTFWKKKSEVNELNPTLNQTGIFNKFNEIYQKKQNEFFSNYKSDKTSFLNMITKVQIGRGRMFKMGDNSAPGYMSKFETSYIIPRTLMIFPEYYNYSWNKLQNEEWEENDAKTHC